MRLLRVQALEGTAAYVVLGPLTRRQVRRASNMQQKCGVAGDCNKVTRAQYSSIHTTGIAVVV